MRFFSGLALAERDAGGAQHLMGVADPAGELDAIKELEHLDRQVAADARAVAECGGGHQAVVARLRQGFGNLAEPAQGGGLKEPALAQPDHQPMARGAPQQGFDLAHIPADRLGDVLHRRRAQRILLQQRGDFRP
ncbi:MAG TPA: hypothetical protein VEM36_15330 [Xanthobacteraceae bacterium]|nr:hypothetical protein [Xanthobacteraceae bacterium]